MQNIFLAASLAFSPLPRLAPPSVRACRDGCDATLPPLSTIGARASPRSRTPVAVSPAELWSGYLGLLETAPLTTKAISAGVIIGAGDAAAQTVENAQKGGDFDFARYLRWAFIGLVLQGPWCAASELPSLAPDCQLRPHRAMRRARLPEPPQSRGAVC